MAKFKCAGALRKPPSCSHTADTRWRGFCPGCGGLDKIIKARLGDVGDDAGVGRSLTSLANAASSTIKYRPTGVDGFDRVIGGGLVDGTMVLLGGPRGVGKTTLLVQIAGGFAEKTGEKVIYVSAEESLRDIGHVAGRLGLSGDKVFFLGNESDVLKVVDLCVEQRPRLLIWDSVATGVMEDLEADVGTPTQIDAIANYFTTFVKTMGTIVLLVCHVSMRGKLAGTAKLQHLVDTIVYFRRCKGEEDGFDDVRELLIDEKNRKGPDNVTALVEMTDKGLRPFRRKPKLYVPRGRED